MNFKFGNWKKFRTNIQSNGQEIVKFDFKYHTCDFRIIYALAQNVFIIAKQGTQQGFILNLKAYESLTTVDRPLYKVLAKCKDSVYGPDKKYHPFDFLVELNKFIGTNITFTVPSKLDFGETSSSAIPDEKKIFFQRWIPHTTHGNVTNENLNKIDKLLGYNIMIFCKKQNISVGFRTTPSERSIEVVKDFEKDYSKYSSSTS